MPTYCFENRNTGKCVHRSYPIAECPKVIRVRDRAYRKNCVCPNSGKSQSAKMKAVWPVWSESSAVPPSDIEKAVEFNRKNGCPTEFDEHGRPGLTGLQHQRKFLKINKMFDKGAYY